MEREVLERLVGEGLTVRAMAAELRVSYTTVRYWLQRHGLQTPRGRRLEETRAARDAGHAEVVAFCAVHGTTRLGRRRHAIVGQGARGGRKVRLALRELPRGGRSRRPSGTLCQRSH